MEIVLLIKVNTKDNQIELNYTKTYTSVSLPSIGTEIIDDLFAIPQEIIKIVLNYSKDQCLVTLKPREESKERLSGHIQEVAALHNWTLFEQ